MRGMPLTSSGAICVPTSDLHGSFASAAACRTTSDLPTPGGDSSSTLCSWARQRISCLAWLRVTVSCTVVVASLIRTLSAPPQEGGG